MDAQEAPYQDPWSGPPWNPGISPASSSPWGTNQPLPRDPRLPAFTTLPIPTEPSHPHRILHDLINYSHYSRHGRFTSTAHATVLRQLFQTVWRKPEWVPFFDMAPEDAAGMPGSKSMSDWLWLGEDGLERGWKLSEAQSKVEKTSPPSRGKSCGKILHRFDRTYSCKTCAADASCVLCVDCFSASDHEGHEILFGQSFSFAAACDCGDSSAWLEGANNGCEDHPPLPPDEEAIDPPLGFITAAKVPAALLSDLYTTIVICLEFIINTMQHSPLPSTYSDLPKDLKEMMSSSSNFPTGEPIDRRSAGPWSVILWADEKHVMKEVTRQIRDALGLPWNAASYMAREADTYGRKCVLVTPNALLAFHTASMFQQIDLGVTLRLAGDTFKEEVVKVIIGWLSDMCCATIAGDPNLFRRLVARAFAEPRLSKDQHRGAPLAPDLQDLLVTPDLCRLPRREHVFGNEPTRLDWMMRLDVRLWRRAKWDMRQIYSAIYGTDRHGKRQLACRFGANYVAMFEHYLFHDRELDTNLIFSIAYMVFGHAIAAANASVHVGLFETVLDVAESWYSGNGKSLILPASFEVPRLDTTTPAFRGKKAMTIFGHVRILFRHPLTQMVIVASPFMTDRVFTLLHLFVGLQPQHRVLDEHVEYEVEWPRSFAILAELSKCCREFGECFRHAEVDVTLATIHRAIKTIRSDMLLLTDRLDPEIWTPPVAHRLIGVLDAGTQFDVIDINVATIKAFTFHHYFHLAIAEMIKSLMFAIASDGGLANGVSFPDIFKRALQIPGAGDSEKIKLLILEWPLQMHVVLSQIRADMWKKNGVAMRGQYHHYREMNVREATVDQDFFLLQFCLCILDPYKFFVAVIDRFGLVPWFRDPITQARHWNESEMDPKQVIAIMEDFVLLVIHIVTETTSVCQWDQTRVTRKHIIHQLALGKLSYAELLKKLPERCAERRSILNVLRSVSDFHRPTMTANGAYTLKEECYAEVDPYWRHYTRNEQRTATAKLVERAKKSDQTTEPLLMPLPLEFPPPGQPMSNLGAFLSNNAGTDIVYWVVAHCMYMADQTNWPGLEAAKNEAPQLDNLLDLALHLSMIIISVAPKEFAERSVHIQPKSQSMSLFQKFWFMQTSEVFKAFRPKLDYVLKAIVERLPETYTAEYRESLEASKLVQDPEESKAQVRAAAAARQKAIMAEFAKKQADFASLMEEDDDEEDIMDEVKEEEESYGQCIVCQDDVTHQRPGGMLALMQPSRVLRDVFHDRDWLEESLATPVCLDNATRHTRFGLDSTGEPIETDGYPSTHYRFGAYISACNHVMHETCIGTYFEATRWRHTQQVGRHHPENAVRMEYMCPLCKSLGNILIPLDTTQTPFKSAFNRQGKLPTLSEKIRSVSEEGLIRVSDSARIWDHHIETGELTPWFTDCNFSLNTLDPVHRRQVMRPISRMIERMRNLLRPLSDQSTRIRGKKSSMYLPDDVVAYTIAISEITQRGLARAEGALSVAEQVPDMSMKLIKKLVGVLQLELDLFFGPNYDRTALRVGIFARFLPDWYRASTLPSPLLLRNPLGMVVETAAIAPDLLHPVIVMAYYANLTRVMLGLSIYARRVLVPKTDPQPRTPAPEEPEREDAMSIFADFRNIMHGVFRSTGPFNDSEAVLSLFTDEMLAKLLYAHTLPFLRRAAIIYYSVTGTYPDPHGADSLTNACEYNRLMALLCISHPKDTLPKPNSTEAPIVSRWLTQWSMQGRYVPPLEFPGTYELYRLPVNWERMILLFTDLRCEKCNTKPSFPAVCLFCGAFVCLGGDCCAEGEQGECNLHMRECGAAVGMFVDIKRWVILYLYAGSGCFQAMPYLDSHGELDPSLRRGHRQSIHVGRWDELRRATWLQHTIPHLTARRLELTNDQGGWTCL
ncbi:ubiquitin-protein ligase [Kockovaella imperatae]|uniref:E3 ubiquitin-protein ligase n=1 Tax=Kockovaella imperatae TaxID=4999 RepID=A0A1Y1UKL0_9TREE|nr:ubiquitin-protein ligase [Kockovaella imperatae]ORX38539.1 ubiquitin-protein ligase [Kockovaella imperatae]